MRTAIFISFLIAIIAFMATPIAAERRSPIGSEPNLVVRSPKSKVKSGGSGGGDDAAASGTPNFGLPNHVAHLGTVGAAGAVAVAILI